MASPEESKFATKANFSPTRASFEHAKLEIERLKAEAGVLRWLIGTGDHARINGSFLFVTLMIVLSGIIIWAAKDKGIEFCKTFTMPIIMGGLGYFAASGKKNP